MPASREGIPDTIKRSPAKVRRTYTKALDAAHDEYGSEERAHRTAWSAVKHIAQKRGDHWELKDRPGPSDAQAKRGRTGHRHAKKTAGGVDVLGSTRDELYARARKADIRGRSGMSKAELGRALARKGG